jgi:lipoprotein NlpD
MRYQAALRPGEPASITGAGEKRARLSGGAVRGALGAMEPGPGSMEKSKAMKGGPGGGLLLRNAVLRVLAALVLLQLTQACGSPGGSVRSRGTVYTHVVARGDTVWLIAQRYGTTVSSVVRANRLRDPSRISVGQRLRVPVPGRTPRPEPDDGGDLPRGGGGRWIWPVDGVVTSSFGWRGWRRHEGIDIMAPSGTPVYAAAPGRVAYSGNGVSGYGNLVVIRHEDSAVSVYGHNRRNLVRVGQWVEQGDVIAEVGQTGRASGPHLHFEVRRGGRPQNPRSYLP